MGWTFVYLNVFLVSVLDNDGPTVIFSLSIYTTAIGRL